MFAGCPISFRCPSVDKRSFEQTRKGQIGAKFEAFITEEIKL